MIHADEWCYFVITDIHKREKKSWRKEETSYHLKCIFVVHHLKKPISIEANSEKLLNFFLFFSAGNCLILSRSFIYIEHNFQNHRQLLFLLFTRSFRPLVLLVCFETVIQHVQIDGFLAEKISSRTFFLFELRNSVIHRTEYWTKIKSDFQQETRMILDVFFYCFFFFMKVKMREPKSNCKYSRLAKMRNYQRFLFILQLNV